MNQKASLHEEVTGSEQSYRPIWDRGEAIDAEMMAFTIGDDWLQDQRLVLQDLRGSVAHARGLERIGLLDKEDGEAIVAGLEQIREDFLAGRWNLVPTDEDVHSAVEKRLIELVGEAGKRLHTGRSRNDQVALDLRLWLRDAKLGLVQELESLQAACQGVAERYGSLPLPGYTRLRRAMPSSIVDWIGAYARAFELVAKELAVLQERLALCPLGSGAGYGVPLPLDRAGVASELEFEQPEMPVTFTQFSRGRAELAYVTALEGLALDLGKLAFDLWLFSSQEFGFVELPVALTTGSSLMPQKRNPDLIELLRAQCRQVLADRAALVDALRDLPSGYHRDFQLIKPPLFRAHDRVMQALPLVRRLLSGLEFDAEKLREAAGDPSLQATAKALDRVRAGEAFRDAYRSESLERES